MDARTAFRKLDETKKAIRFRRTPYKNVDEIKHMNSGLAHKTDAKLPKNKPLPYKQYEIRDVEKPFDGWFSDFWSEGPPRSNKKIYVICGKAGGFLQKKQITELIDVLNGALRRLEEEELKTDEVTTL